MRSPLIFEPRKYRDSGVDDHFSTFRVVVEQSDLYVKALAPLEKETERLLRDCRAQIENAIANRPEFLTSLDPIEEDPADAPVAAGMILAGKKAGTGPMAAVAGAVAEFVGRALLEFSAEVIIENGGDIFVMVSRPIVVGLCAGDSALSGRVGIKVGPTPFPVGICTSSGPGGPSRSFGRADAAMVVSRDVALADAVATALGNRVERPSDLKAAVEWAHAVPGVDGALALLGERLAVLGQIELVPTDEDGPEG